MKAPFIHLNVHSEYSISDSLIRINELIRCARDMHMPAVALTDSNNLFAMVKFYQKAQAAGIKPIIGAEVLVENCFDSGSADSLILLCMGDAGYRNLTQLISDAYLNARDKHSKILVTQKALQAGSADLLAISLSQGGPIAQALFSHDTSQALRVLNAWQDLFGDRFYIEICRTGRQGEDAYQAGLARLNSMSPCHLVASNAVRFLKASDFEAHEARVCIQSGHTLEDPMRPQHHTDKQYFKSSAEMRTLFHDMPEAIENAYQIALRCNLKLNLNQVYLPNFPVPTGLSMDEFFIQEAQNGLTARLADKAQLALYQERLQTELAVINKMGFAGYFLIVADFIRWAKTHGIPVGPGRGSGAGSLVAFALEITDIDPLIYDLLFERFLNPERVSMPDFDIDFCMEGRDAVIEYVAERYGRDAVSQIITYGTMAAKAVIRDVGRVLGHPYGFVDKIAKLIPLELGITLERALATDESLRRRYEDEEEVRLLIDLARKLEGLTRNVGKHAGGVVIAPSKLTDFTPLYCDSEEQSLVTQFDKNDVETIGLVKFDFLGLRTLTILDWAMKSVNLMRQQQGQEPLALINLPLEDSVTFDLLRACQTTAIFQLESRGMKDLIRRLKPDVFEDIIALVALFRPGPLQSGMVDDFINRKHGRAKLEYPHPDLEPILKPTYGIILYQEQVMQIAQVLAGYTLGAADMLRRAMGKKNANEMAKQRENFQKGATERGVPLQLAVYIFDLMEKFAGYGFNKSHSAAYAMVTYQTAWVKAHYPAAFMAAVLSSDMTNTDKVVIFIEECRAMGLKVIPPNVNLSHYQFTVSAEQSIIYGLGAIKGVGEAAIQSMLEARQHGPFKDLYDLTARVDARKINRRVLEALLRSGSLDVLHPERAYLSAHLEEALAAALQLSQNQLVGQGDLFAQHFQNDQTFQQPNHRSYTPWTERERLAGEKDTLGLYLTGHPIDEFATELSCMVSSSLKHIKPAAKKEQTLAGLILSVRSVMTKRGERMAIVALDDKSARQEVTVFGDVYQANRDRLVKDRLVVVKAEVSSNDFSNGLRIRVSQILDLTQARGLYARYVNIRLNQTGLSLEVLEQLALYVAPKEAHILCPVKIHYQRPEASVHLSLGDGAWISPSEEVLAQVKLLCGPENVMLCYDQA